MRDVAVICQQCDTQHHLPVNQIHVSQTRKGYYFNCRACKRFVLHRAAPDVLHYYLQCGAQVVDDTQAESQQPKECPIQITCRHCLTVTHNAPADVSLARLGLAGASVYFYCGRCNAWFFQPVSGRDAANMRKQGAVMHHSGANDSRAQPVPYTTRPTVVVPKEVLEPKCARPYGEYEGFDLAHDLLTEDPWDHADELPDITITRPPGR